MKQYFTLSIFLFAIVSLIAQQTVGTLLNDPSTSEGYILFPPRKYNTTYLINNQGRKINEWVEATGNRVENVRLLENGILVRAVNELDPFYARFAGDYDRLEMVDWDGNVIWAFEYADNTHILHHDFVPIKKEDGTYNFLVSTWDVVDAATMISEGRNPNATGGNNNFILMERILEIKPTLPSGADIVWEWRAIDHLVQEDYNSEKNYIANGVASNPQLLHVNYFKNTRSNTMAQADWMHVSGLDYNPELDQILIANHGSNEILVIDHSTTTAEAAGQTGGTYGKGGDILYRWGNPAAYQGGDNGDKVFNALHNPHWIPDALSFGGKIMVFNNGFNSFSTIEIISPPQTSPGIYKQPSVGSSYGPASSEYVYENGNEFHSTNMGSAQFMPNGNLLINEAVKGTFFEIDPSENIVWEYVSPLLSTGPMNFDVDISTIPTTPGGDQDNEVFKIYKYSPDYPGFEGQDLRPGDFIELNNPSTSNTAEHLFKHEVHIYPNPTNDFINISIDPFLPEYYTNIYSASGKLMLSGEHNGNTKINTSTLKSGVYFVKIQNEEATTFKKIIKH